MEIVQQIELAVLIQEGDLSSLQRAAAVKALRQAITEDAYSPAGSQRSREATEFFFNLSLAYPNLARELESDMDSSKSTDVLNLERESLKLRAEHIQRKLKRHQENIGDAATPEAQKKPDSLDQAHKELDEEATPRWIEAMRKKYGRGH